MDSKPYKDNSRPKTPSKPESDFHLPINPRRKFRRRGTGDRSNQQDSESEDEDKSTMTDSSDHELDDFGSDDDVESGLPTEERRKFLRRQRKQNNLDSRIANVAGRLSEQEKKEADKNVMQKLVQNTVLILLWYFFSLSISLVSSEISLYPFPADMILVQQMDVLIGQPQLPLSAFYDFSPYGRPVPPCVSGSPHFSLAPTRSQATRSPRTRT